MRKCSATPVRCSLLVLLAITLAACDGGKLDRSMEGPPIAGLPSNVRYAVSYDQKTETFSRYWPADMVASGKASDDVRLLEHYENIRETIAFDEEGNMIRQYRHLEGDAGTRLPEDVLSEFESTMPSRPTGEDPIVAFEMKDGKMRYIGASGATISEHSYDPSKYRIEPAYLDSLHAMQQASQDTSANGRAQQALRKLVQIGVSFDQLDAEHVALEETPSGMGDVTRVRQVIDLRVGQPVLLTYMRADGQPDMVIRKSYERVNGMPVETKSVTYSYGLVDGQWKPAYRTVATRTNVQVVIR